MKLTLFFLLAALMHVSASVYSQQTKLSVSMRDVTVKEVLKQIEEQSEFFFLYKNIDINVNRIVSVDIREKSVENLLDQIFRGTTVAYEVVNRQIVLTDKAKENSLPESQQQKKTISGKVTDSSGATLPGVSVIVKGTTIGVITDNEGKYALSNVPENATLQFSFVGMKMQEFVIEGKTTINVKLEEVTVGIEEIVAIGYGTQKKVNLTGAVSSVNSDFIASRPLTNSTQALQGVNGIYVNQAGSEPGADNATIRIRGIGTLSNNDPLVLVDGIEYNMKDVNPNDVESISVLKDAASSSIYGNRAANGVILITTKKGKSGKLKTELNSYYGWQQATYLPDMVTNSVDYMLARNQVSVNEGQPKPYTDAQVEEYRNGKDPDIYPNTDWYDIKCNRNKYWYSRCNRTYEYWYLNECNKHNTW